MNSKIKQSDKKAAFTIVELLTVMSIIVILIGLLVPALNQVKKYAKEVKQKAQFHAIGVALEFFNGQFETYPDSSPTDSDSDDKDYCGAMKLAEAMVGRDLLGYHPDSVLNSSGKDYQGNFLYNPTSDLSARKTYLDLENANAYRMDDIYPQLGNFTADSVLLCDEFGQVVNRNSGLRMGMPILYYKARPAKTLHIVSNPDNSIYDYRDNQELLLLGKPWDPQSTVHHRLAKEGNLAEGARFYENTLNDKVTTTRRPFNKDTFILISAGNDGEYGTSDDICNFNFKYREL
ncbi:MAG: type II secretion system protein [Sedimentisphaerales bacterium]|nr:type II secretion system protein [Sedimentisphaerales bacterium]